MTELINRPSKIRQKLLKVFLGKVMRMSASQGEFVEIIEIEKDPKTNVADPAGWLLTFIARGADKRDRRQWQFVPLSRLNSGQVFLAGIMKK